MTTIAAAPRPQEIADRVHAYIQPHGGWCVSNAGVLVGRKEVTLVDTAATESRNRALRTAVGRLTSAPPRTVINTHHHGDHTNGNGLFACGAGGAADVVVAHDLAREAVSVTGAALQRRWPDTDWGDLTVTLPTLTFPDELTLYVDDLTVELIHGGPAPHHQ
ncbi:MBL fold metallo-hydrolase [Streptomyces sp. NPDC087263]|uniref:MBL fold metallo-hydrolase n=1 Tax=Streptomyces sp. NPDC087263 TaxID=3365773 RepID=UPI0038233527